MDSVVWAVFSLQAEVNVGADAAVDQRLNWTDIVTHAQEDLRWLVLAQEAQRVHLRKRSGG